VTAGRSDDTGHSSSAQSVAEGVRPRVRVTARPSSRSRSLAAEPRQAEFSRVYEDHVWRVYGFLAYRVRDRGVAEDLTQATFERALRAWSRFDRSRASEWTWLLTIARNLLIDHHRRDRSDRSEDLEEQQLPAAASPELRYSGSAELVEALTRLGDREREVLALRFGADLTGPEIAELTGLSLPNVQQITSRSLRRLRGLLEDAPRSPVPASGSPDAARIQH